MGVIALRAALFLHLLYRLDAHAFSGLFLYRLRFGLCDAAKTAAQHFLMAGEVVGAFDGLDLEAAILAVLRTPALEDNHRADGVGSLRVGDVVAFDALRRRGQVERGLQFFQRQLRLLAVGQPLDTLLLQHLLRVLFDHLNQPPLLAALRFADAERALTPLLQPCLDNSLIFRFHLDDDFRRDVRRRFIELLQERTHHLRRAAVARALQDEVFAPNQLAGAEEEHLGAGLVVAARQRDHVLIVLPLRRDDALLLQNSLYGLDAFADASSLLEIEIFRRLLHLLLKLLQHLVVLAFQKENHLLDDGIILFPCGIADTGRDAAMDIILRAGAGQQLLLPFGCRPFRVPANGCFV